VQTFAQKMWKNKVKQTFCCNIPVFLKESGKKMGKLSAHFGLYFCLTNFFEHIDRFFNPF
jgi:hypothetical protein